MIINILGFCRAHFNVVSLRKMWLGALILAGSYQSPPVHAADSDLSSFEKPQNIPSPAFNPTSVAKINLGRKLFFDQRLSGANSMSCASCHQPEYGWTDPRRFSVGETGKPRPRRTPSLQDVGWNKLFAWDGRVETLEGFVLGPIAHPEELNQSLNLIVPELVGTEDYVELYEAAFGGAPVSIDGIAQSLAVYVRTLQSGVSPFDRWVAGDTTALSNAALNGFELFTGKAGCSQCHSGWRFTDQNFYDIGLMTSDIGRGNLFPDIASMQHAFKTPSLRNVAIRPPYMHDGSIDTLDEVLDFYQSGFHTRPSLSPLIQPISLTAHERLNLIEFLGSLTDDTRQSFNIPIFPPQQK